MVKSANAPYLFKMEANNVLYQPSKRENPGTAPEPNQQYWLLPEGLEVVKLVVDDTLLEYLEKWNYPDTVAFLRRKVEAKSNRSITIKAKVLEVVDSLPAMLNNQPLTIAGPETNLWLSHFWFWGKVFGGVNPNSDCSIPAEFCGLEPAPKERLRLLSL